MGMPKYARDPVKKPKAKKDWPTSQDAKRLKGKGKLCTIHALHEVRDDNGNFGCPACAMYAQRSLR